MTDELTLQFYADNAAAYAGHSPEPTGETLSTFLSQLAPGARVLELGCGNGRDAARMLSLGFEVDATDATPELAREAERRIGRPVRILRFEQLDAVSAYDGIWACASLLHAPAAQLVDILARIRRALRPGGLFVASFKAGAGEGRDALGRYYNYPTPQRLEADYQLAGWSQISQLERLGSGYDARPTRWLWMSARP